MVIKYTETLLGNGKYFSVNLVEKSRSGFTNIKDFQRAAKCFPQEIFVDMLNNDHLDEVIIK